MTTKSYEEEVAAVREAVATLPTRKDRPVVVGMEHIRVRRAVFQPRMFYEAYQSDDAHVIALARSLKAQPKKSRRLDPILVMAIGKHFVCIDGHHRLLAYRTAKVDKVPVEHWKGTVDEAILEAIRRNSKDRLVMRHGEKMEAAWKMVVLDFPSRRLIAEASGASQRSVSTMRSTLDELKEKDLLTEGVTPTWVQALRLKSGKEVEFDEEQVDALTQDWAKRLATAFGPKAAAQPDVFMNAVMLFSPKLHDALHSGCKPYFEDEVYRDTEGDGHPDF